MYLDGSKLKSIGESAIDDVQSSIQNRNEYAAAGGLFSQTYDAGYIKDQTTI
jgi:hypothetical protein